MNVQHSTEVEFGVKSVVCPPRDGSIAGLPVMHQDGYLALYFGGPFADNYRYSLTLDEVDALLAELHRGRHALAEALVAPHDCIREQQQKADAASDGFLDNAEPDVPGADDYLTDVTS